MSRHWKLQESSMWRWFHIAGKCNTGQGVVLPGCNGGLQSGGSALLVVGFSVLVSILLCSLSMSGAALSTRLMGRYVSGDPVHNLASTRGHEWLATCVPVQDVLSQGSWAVVWLVAFQGVRRKPCMLPPFGGNFSHFLSFDFVVGILEYQSVFWLVIIFLTDK